MSFKDRLLPTAVHLLLSVLIVTAILYSFKTVFYPGHILSAVGADKIFMVLFFVDITMGPLLTFIVFDKQKKELRRDLVIIALLQISALGYGVSSLYNARPVYAVFAVDRFELITANGITEKHLKAAEPNRYSSLPNREFEWVVAKIPSSYDERNSITMELLNGGTDLAQRPQYYNDYENGEGEIKAAVKPISKLLTDRETMTIKIRSELEKYADASKFGYLPLTASKYDLTVIINLKTAKPVTIFNVDPW